MGEQKNSCDAPSLRESSDTSAEPKRSWWWSRDEERFIGPCYSRADAIMEAWSDDADRGAFICQAAQEDWRTDVYSPDWLAEQFDEANEEACDPEGDPPSSILGAEVWKRVAAAAATALRQALRRNGMKAWAFVNQGPSEWVDIPTMWRAAEAAEAQASESNRNDGSSPQTENPHA